MRSDFPGLEAMRSDFSGLEAMRSDFPGLEAMRSDFSGLEAMRSDFPGLEAMRSDFLYRSKSMAGGLAILVADLGPRRMILMGRPASSAGRLCGLLSIRPMGNLLSTGRLIFRTLMIVAPLSSPAGETKLL
jgi:hypothetical protein